MAERDTYNCCRRVRDEIELSEGVRPMAVLVDEDSCGCWYGEVELYTSKEPDVLLFEEYCEEYADDIVLAKEAAEAAKKTVEDSSETIKEIKEAIDSYVFPTFVECSVQDIIDMFPSE